MASALLRRRPDVREAERELAAATARIGVATADLYPSVTLGVSAGSTGELTDFLTTPPTATALDWAFTGKPTNPSTRAHIAAVGATARAALRDLDGVVLTALRDTESALARYTRDLQRDADLAAAQARAGEAQQEAQRLYDGGKIDFLSLLDAQRTLASADGVLAASHAQLATDQIAIFLALGGGWQ